MDNVRTDKVVLGFPDLAQRLKTLNLPEVDLVVGIATGGTVPASLVAYELERPLKMLTINYRDADNRPRGEVPELLEPFTPPADALRILLIDDVSVSGKTLGLAKGILRNHVVTTLVFKGKADFVVLPEVASCVVWPWQESSGVGAGSSQSATRPILSTCLEETL